MERRLNSIKEELEKEVEKVVNQTKKDELLCEKIIVVVETDPIR